MLVVFWMATSSQDIGQEQDTPEGPTIYSLLTLTAEQAAAFAATQALLSARRPGDFKGELSSDGAILKFLIARQFKAEDACQMILAAEAWFAENQPERLLIEAVEGRLPDVERGKTVWWQHRDSFGRPVLLCFAACHQKSAELAEKIHHSIYCLEEGARRCRLAEDGVRSYFIVLLDLTGLGWEHVDLPFYSAILGILQNFYPERVGAFYICNAGWKFHVLWKTVRGWLDKRTCSKIFVNPSLQQLEQVLPLDQLPIAFGGLATNPSR